MYAECRHILPRGTKCKSPALTGRPYCYYHDKLHDYTQDGLRDDKGPICLPSIEDACGVQHALMQIMGSIANGRLGSRRGARLLYGLQIAIQAMDRVPPTPPDEIVRATACDGIGVDIARSEGKRCEPHTDCPTCTSRFGCYNVARQNKESLRDLIDEEYDRRERAEREPLALPAGGTDAPLVPHEQAFIHGGMDAALLPVPAPGATSPSGLQPALATTDQQKRAEKEADMEARVNKFRPNQREADLDARARELSRMMAAHEITLDEAFALSPDDPLPISASRRGKRSRADEGR